MYKTIRLCKTWSDKGTEYPVDTLLEVDAVTADELIGKGIAELIVKVEAGDEKDNKSADTAAGENKTDDTAITAETLSKMLDDKLDVIQKRVTPRPVPIRVTRERIEDDPYRGYQKGPLGFGEYLQEVVKSATPHGALSDRLKVCQVRGKAVGSDEYTTVEDSIGGYFILPPAYVPEILQKGIEPDFVRTNGARLLSVPRGSTGMYINAITDADRTDTLYGGVQVYIQKERAQMTATRGEFERVKLEPSMLTGMYFATDNEIHHVAFLGALLGQLFQDAITFKEMSMFVNGTGGGEPLGILNAACVYSLAKETGQAAATIETENVVKMQSHMRPAEYQNAVWLASLSCMEQLELLTINVGTGGAPVSMVSIGADGITRLRGRPLIYTEQCQAVGTVGDLILVSFPTYLVAETDYTSVDSSIHIRFDYNETAFRVVKTIDAQPWWRSTLTLKNSWEVAPIITLAARA